MSADFFVDSNVVVYALDTPSPKRDIARSIIARHPVISPQVAMETINVLIKKLKFTRANALASMATMIEQTTVSPVSENELRSAFDISLRYQLSHWDSLIIASALSASCTTLYSEDLRHGQKIETLSIINPFV